MDNFEMNPQYTQERKAQIQPIFNKLIPKSCKSCLDIGSGRDNGDDWLRKKFVSYWSLDIENADIIQDLNKKGKINIQDNKFDIVILSDILEHLVNPEEVLKEAIRISNKYILIGLPNEYPLSRRLEILFGKWEDKVYPYGHKHTFSVSSIEEFINHHFKSYKRKTSTFKFKRERYFTTGVKELLIRMFPSLFIGEVFYLIEFKGGKHE